MKSEKFLLLSVVVIVCVASATTFAQGQAVVQRLPVRHTVKRAPSQTSPTTSTAAGTATAAAAAIPGLPLWTFNVESNRDGNEYTGVMVGTSPFNEGSGQTSVATQIVPIVIRTHTVGLRSAQQGLSRPHQATRHSIRHGPTVHVSDRETTIPFGCFPNHPCCKPRTSTMAAPMWGPRRRTTRSREQVSGRLLTRRTAM